jgi:hypothetical protein
MLNAPSSVKLTPPPPPHCKQFEPPEVLNAPPAEPEASKLVPLNFVLAVTVVPVIAAGVVPPMAGGLDRSSVPPNVRLPDVVTVPVKDNPLTVPAPLTEVTVPDPAPAAPVGPVGPGVVETAPVGPVGPVFPTFP